MYLSKEHQSTVFRCLARESNFCISLTATHESLRIESGRMLYIVRFWYVPTQAGASSASHESWPRSSCCDLIFRSKTGLTWTVPQMISQVSPTTVDNLSTALKRKVPLFTASFLQSGSLRSHTFVSWGFSHVTCPATSSSTSRAVASANLSSSSRASTDGAVVWMTGKKIIQYVLRPTSTTVPLVASHYDTTHGGAEAGLQEAQGSS